MSNVRSTILRVGVQKRYADANQRRRFNREAEAHALVPRSLTDTERGTDAVTQGPPVPVKAWVDYGNASTQILGSAVALTRRCVLVLWVDSHDQQQQAWLWAGAVERIER